VMQPILFMYELFSTSMAFYNWMVMNMSGMLYEIIIGLEFLSILIAFVFRVVK
jgi:hypothetical protein